MLQYWLAVFIKGFRDSLNFVMQDRDGILFGFLILAITAFWLWKEHGWRDAMKYWWRTVGEGLIIAVVAFILVLIAHLLWEPYHLQDDLLANRRSLQLIYDHKDDEFRTCGSELKTEEARSGLLSDRVASQQGIINSQQASLVAQQGTVNTCVVSLAKMNELEPLKTTVLQANISPDQVAVAPWIAHVLLLTNKIQTPVSVIIQVDQPLIKGEATIMGAGITIGGSQIVATNALEARFTSPAFSPTSPLIFTLYTKLPITSVKTRVQ